MKTVTTFLITLALALAGSAASAAAIGTNLLANPGFEDPIVYGGDPPFDFNWLNFGDNVFAEPGVNWGAGSSPINPRTGDGALEMFIFDFSGTFVGVLQQVTGLSPGQPVEFRGWHAGFSEGGSVDSGVEIRIEWFDSASGVEIGRTPNLTPTPGDTYEEFVLPGIVPTGADSATLVVALVSQFGPAGLNVIELDDTSFTVVPLPGALILMLGALGSLSLFRKRVA